ncbi:MAG: EI24 domain-containing protein [Defluviitaleaceae bacterium]|nr:EI24 domain-containing protein [Defluviitaleaceae bacterium]MCL2239754.1 EI24 domain-containing protein [Defluviitaleaceae bacterium]
MDGKVILYDSNDVKIGETYIKRARQLVKKQRASWVDDSYKSIRFAPGAESLEAIAMQEEEHDDGWLVELAAKRITQRKRFIFHSIAFIPGWFLLFGFITLILDDATTGAIAFVMFVLGAWVTGYVIHVCQYALPRLNKHRAHTREERKAKMLAMEVANLKAELQRHSA